MCRRSSGEGWKGSGYIRVGIACGLCHVQHTIEVFVGGQSRHLRGSHRLALTVLDLPVWRDMARGEWSGPDLVFVSSQEKT